MAGKSAASKLSDFEQHVSEFVAKVKDDPFLSELFRVAANELHAKLNPDAEPAQDEQA